MRKTEHPGGGTYSFSTRPKIIACAAVAGKKESEGPCGKLFDKVFEDARCGEDTFEKAESLLQKTAAELAVQKALLDFSDVDMLYGGDLLNQCMATSIAIAESGVPFFGLYGACSTMAESLILASIAVDGGFAGNALCVTSSHFCASERQYRFPLEYGNQRTQNAQWTVTGSGAAVVSARAGKSTLCEISRCTPGRIVDFNVTDLNNMGAAMAPAACNTLARHFKNTGTVPADYDLILTGDLGHVGSTLLRVLCRERGYTIDERHNDCGLMIYDREKQDVHSGGSGCGCSASVLCSNILNAIAAGKYNRVLFMATGALMSPTSSQQGSPIMGIAHLLELEAVK